VVAEVVEVDPEHDRGLLLRSQRCERIHQRVLAPVAAVAVVASIGGVRHLLGDHLQPAKTPLAGERATVVLLEGRQ